METVLSKLPSLDVVTSKLNKEELINNWPFVLVTAGVTVSSGVYIYYKNKNDYWKKRGVKGPEPRLIIGNFNMQYLSIADRLVEWSQKYGKVYGILHGTRPILVIGEPELVTEVLIKNFHKFTDRRNFTSHRITSRSMINQNGAEWKQDRAVMSPTFSSGKMKQMYPLMRESYDCLDREFKRLAEIGDEVDIKSVFAKLTTMVIARCAFATHVDAFTDPNNELLRNLKAIFFISRTRLLGNLLLPQAVKKLIGFSITDPSVVDYIARVCKKILEQRKNSQEQVNEYPDLMQLLMDTNKNNNGRGFDDIKIIANSITFFNAGHETTSTLLTWASYALAMNPDIQEKLHQEVKEAKEAKGQLDYETLFDLKYLDAVINETLRLYPPVAQFERVATEDHTLSNGITLEKGNVARIPVYALHHDPDNFEEPSKFNPERFMPENKDSIRSGSFVPFVIGPRNCIGMRFALLEAKMTLAELMCKYKFVKSKSTPEKVVYARKTFILTLDNYKVKIEKRL